jgi:hypothetical protein
MAAFARAGGGNRPALPLARALVRCPQAIRNSRRTICYHFATQLGSTGWNKVAQDRRRARRNPHKPALSDTGRHVLKR